MPKYLPYNYNQTEMIALNFADQLQPGTFQHTIHYLIEQRLDLSICDLNYDNDDTGRYAYDPAVLLKIILFAYSKGITSSREIQWCCETNITFMALACGRRKTEIKSNVTDNQSAKMTTSKGTIQGYNAKFGVNGCNIVEN